MPPQDSHGTYVKLTYYFMSFFFLDPLFLEAHDISQSLIRIRWRLTCAQSAQKLARWRENRDLALLPAKILLPTRLCMYYQERPFEALSRRVLLSNSTSTAKGGSKAGWSSTSKKQGVFCQTRPNLRKTNNRNIKPFFADLIVLTLVPQ